MLFPSLNRHAHGSPFGQQLQAGFGTLRFAPALESEFRDYYLKFSLGRMRIAAAIALVMMALLVGLDLTVGTHLDHQSSNPLRIGVLFPLLVLSLLATLHPNFKRMQQPLFAAMSLVFGIVLSYTAVSTALQGSLNISAALVLFIVYAYLLLGLLFHSAVMVTSVVALCYVTLGALFGLPGTLLFYQGVLLCATCAAGALGAYTLEHALRTSYLESRLLAELAQRDGMTGLYNRRMFDDQVSRLWRQASRDQVPVQIILVDIDYFKIYNDLYGHQAGDDCLKRVATTLNNEARRPFDLCARYGGEEFVLVLYEPPPDYAQALPERLRREVAALGIRHEGSPVADVVTVSIGVAMATPGVARSLAGIVQMADEALYQAKGDGRNCVVVCEECSQVTTGSFRASRPADAA